jgi:2-polyprenyl-3-methyl-5-hydroxy-6-metoxy-1,4-benzoquinol methylase
MPRVITEIKDLKAEIDAVSQIAASGDAGWATQLGCFSFAPNVDHLQAMDPRSQAYFEEQYLLYEQIRGGVYESSNELHGSEPFPGIYPYFTRNLQEIGTHLIRIANVVGSLPLNAGDTVLELGSGWGNLSLTLAKSGLNVTTLDIEPRFKRIIDERAAAAGVQIRSRCADFSTVVDDPDTYDCVLFFEAFHHARNHLELFRITQERVAPDGVMVWASEPIWEHLTLPWSLRLDSLALYCIRRFGWFETGFTESYFLDMLLRSGWTCTKSELTGIDASTVFIARRAKGKYKIGEILLPPQQARTWHRPEGTHRWTTAESVIRLPELNGTIDIDVHDHSNSQRRVRLTVGRNTREFTLEPGRATRLTIQCDSQDSLLKINSDTWRPSDHGSDDPRILGVAVEQMLFR